MAHYGYCKNQYKPINGNDNANIQNNGNFNLKKFINFLEL